MYVAVGADGNIYTRGDGDTSWTVASSSYGNLRDVTYADGKFIVACYGLGGRIITSEDGVNWTTITVDGGTQYYDTVAGGGGIIVATDWEGAISTCDSNGVWTTNVNCGFFSLYDVIYVEGVGFAAAGHDGSNGGAIYTSQDGKTWIPQENVPNYGFHGITYNHDSGKFMAVGDGGEVVEITLSPSSLPPLELWEPGLGPGPGIND
jgi:hypothetical protein